MIKKILPLSIVVLVVVLGILYLIQLSVRNTTSGNTSLKPTLYQTNTSSRPVNSSSTTNIGTKNTAEIATITEDQFLKKLPIQTADFNVAHSDRMEKYVVSLESEGAEIAYNEWLQANPSYANILIDGQTIVTKQTIKELHGALDYAKQNVLTPEKKAQQNAKVFTDSLNTLINLPFTLMQSIGGATETTTEPGISPTAAPKKQTKNASPTSTPSPSAKGFAYYSQCSGPYDSVSLPEGCNVCDAGCGPTSVAMILSTYIDSSLTPPKTIGLMKAKGVRMGCFGSYIAEIYDYLQSRGDLKVSSYIISGQNAKENEVAADFRGYTEAGWSIFALANFKENGGGHYFWITDVTADNKIMAYDPYYGKERPAPIAESQYSPAPYYRYAFAVKKI